MTDLEIGLTIYSIGLTGVVILIARHWSPAWHRRKRPQAERRGMEYRPLRKFKYPDRRAVDREAARIIGAAR